ncbi:cytochrome c [Candidatus Binatia bacterium]|nr:cytochrome c [Candidatus Binatia bacterium]
MLKTTGSIVAGLAVALAVLTAATAMADGDAARGKAIFAEKCTSCHGTDGKGDGPMAVAMSPPPANFTDPAFWKTRTDATIANAIMKGHLDMPPMDSKPQDVADLVAYLTQTFKK